MKAAVAVTGLALAAAGWAAALILDSFAAHMTAHMLVVAVAAPALAVTVPWRPAWVTAPAAALAACALELVVVWGWHLPLLHAAARASFAVFVLEQMSFLAAGYAVWASAVPHAAETQYRSRALAGVGALLLTSMHMALLGGLLAVARSGWYHGSVADQQLGGVIMLAFGGVTYLGGALLLLGRVLGQSPDEDPA